MASALVGRGLEGNALHLGGPVPSCNRGFPGEAVSDVSHKLLQTTLRNANTVLKLVSLLTDTEQGVA